MEVSWTEGAAGDVAEAQEWVLLVYRLPREPSTPRITLWRKLEQLGVARLGDGLVALPADARTQEQLGWLADEVLEAGGSASVWSGRPGSAVHEATMVRELTAARAEEYSAVATAAEAAATEPPEQRKRVAEKLRRELRRIGRRDFFPPPQRERAVRAVDELADQGRADPPERLTDYMGATGRIRPMAM